MAPEIQLEKSKYAVPACDAFSLGLLICSVYNGGRSLIQAQYNPACYVKELGRVSKQSRHVISIYSASFHLYEYTKLT